jgi:hypothetical protein
VPLLLLSPILAHPCFPPAPTPKSPQAPNATFLRDNDLSNVYCAHLIYSSRLKPSLDKIIFSYSNEKMPTGCNDCPNDSAGICSDLVRLCGELLSFLWPYQLLPLSVLCSAVWMNYFRAQLWWRAMKYQMSSKFFWFRSRLWSFNSRCDWIVKNKRHCWCSCVHDEISLRSTLLRSSSVIFSFTNGCLEEIAI